MKVKIQSFAELKEYFTPEFELEIRPDTAVAEVLKQLELLNPEAKKSLLRSRIAIDMKFVSSDFIIKENDIVYLIPPSSGG